MHSPATTPGDIAAATAYAGITTPPAHPSTPIIRSPTGPAAITPTPPKNPHHPEQPEHPQHREHPEHPVKTTTAATTALHSIATDRRTHEPSTNASVIYQKDFSAPTTSSSRESQTPSSVGKQLRIRSSRPRTNKWLHYAATHREHGMSTAEYAVGTIAACAFAALLFKVVSSPEVQAMLTSLIDRALKTGQE
ncbi:DUF4244 domain-containing protein [Nonomuraea sp. GTA35]|uniref:DUF4244 domain-containing protein n=1 Tax=Nonomuraea sp. GTA35 TaxID=1676746 RepID=UPI0035C24237